MQDIKYGRVVHRREDFRLMQGRGLYAADVALDGMTHAVFVRSPHAHARIRSIDTVAARRAKDVVAIFAAADLDADGVRDCSLPTRMQRPGGGEVTETLRPPLVRDQVRFLSEPVVMVVAKSLVAARDAAELVNEGLTGAGKFKLSQPTYPNGCHICEVEIDPDTGQVEVIGYVGVEDVGRVLHPAFVEGQIHGGVAQGMGAGAAGGDRP